MPETVSFEHYEVLTRDDGSLYELGRGAMGVTYKAFDANLRIPVALKVINGPQLGSELARQRFIREARSAAKLQHRNVATVYHLGTEGDAWFYAMEFIDGETVEALVKRHGPLEPAAALQIAAQVARALNAAVPHGLVHRDLKPANLMLIREDDELVVKVIDFGLAVSSHPEEGDENETLAGFVGTPHFASPEQLQEKELDVRSDIYSLGATLWFMLAGGPPFSGGIDAVKTQHLTAVPPFEQLARLPEPVLALLRKMLAKEPTDRHQTPQELRRAVEESLQQISGIAAPSAGAEDEALTALLDDAQSRAGETQFEPSAVIAGRYRIAEVLGETNTGRAFRCYDRERQRDVRMLVLNPDLIADPAAYTQVEREVERIAAVKHENLLQILALESTEGATFLILEWTDGFSVLELLRVRRELEADETLLLLQQAARGADHALAAGLKRVDFALHQILLHFGQSIDKEKLLRAPLATWPAFTLKLNPLGITRELSASETWAGAQTMVQGAQPGAEEGDVRARSVQAIGAVAYELLGGTLSPLLLLGAEKGTHYTPLSTLSEEGNEVLKRALDQEQSFPDAQHFFAALQKIEVLEIKHAGTSGAKPKPARTPAPASATLSSRTRSGENPAARAPRKPKFPTSFFLGLFTVAVVGAGVILLRPNDPGKDASANPSSAETPDETSGAEGSRNATPEPVARVSAEEILEDKNTATEKAGEEALRAAIARAEAAEAQNDPAKTIAAWLQVARDFPQSDLPQKHLDFVIHPLRRRPESRKPELFDLLQPLLIEAARRDVVSAMLLLGEGLQDRNLKEAFAWFSAAAEKGHPESFLPLGLLLSNGIGADPQLEKAFYYFKLAAENNDPDAKMALAECYLYGKGTGKDFTVGVKWLKEAAQQGNLRAMNRLADGYDHGRFELPVNREEAFRLWSKVVEARGRGTQHRQPIGEAHGNLGV
ncbi:MAG TPA: protein kinase, partial [Chthoniobacteraceae bacterium]